MGKKLYITWGSPPVNAVLMAAKALSIDLDLHELDLSQQENLSEWYLKVRNLIIYVLVRKAALRIDYSFIWFGGFAKNKI